MYLCKKHRTQMDRHGRIIYSIYDANTIIEHSGYAEIVLKDKNGYEVGIAVINVSDLDKCKPYKWGLTKDGYVLTTINKKPFYLHRHLLDAKTNEYVDHIDFNPLNNKRENLRMCTNSQNLMHRSSLQSNNTSGYHGIHFIKGRNKYRVEIQANGQKIYYGYYINIEDAIRARKEAELKYFGEYKSFFMEDNYENY